MKIFLLALLSLIAVLVNFNTLLTFFLILLFLILSILNKRYFNAKNITLLIVIFLAFFIRSGYIQNNNHSIFYNDKKYHEVEIVDNISINGDFLKTVGYISDEKVIINYKINSEKEKQYFKNSFLGGTLYTEGTIDDIKEKKNYYSFNSKEYNNNQGIFKVYSIEKIIAIEDEQYSSIYRKIQSFRLKFIKNIESNIKFNKSGYFEALIYGDKSNMFNDYIESYRELGISHLLAISGLHIATLVSLLYIFLRYFNISDFIIESILFITLPLYNILTGLQPSTLRASFMVILYIIFRKKISSLSSLLLTFMILLLVNPLYIFHIGFQYSFLVTFSLIMSEPCININNNYVIKLFKISFISYIAGVPISLANFYTLSFISIFSNVIFVPYFTIIIFPLILISYINFLISVDLFNYVFVPVLNTVFYISDYLEGFFLKVANYIHIGKQENLLIYILTFFIFLFLIFLNKRNYKKSSIILIILILILGSTRLYSEDKFEKLTITNRSVYFVKKNKTSYLVNTSNNFQEYYKDFRKKDKSYDIMREYDNILRYEGIYYIDYLIISKKNSRDIGYARNLIGTDKIKNLIVLKNIEEDDKIKEIINIAKFKNINVNFLDKGIYKINDIAFNVDNDKIILSYNGKKYDIS
ncbi:ComEC/Rec2 family competence protein [Gemella sp. GH3]|uniref:ComEC/Rec2 family competence protein n=1 Tax=unclassified Gemella TaxID=2624949 RepID=UPI0015CF9596|nr:MULTISPECIES: ComEC/Rec2 family competence protein [unclassified Gemella]MBF0713318.1 ComEC/Rec2 family competence protein [Gemella sp. GH3.1]NYS50270.1 ComEC/Rec2 family competence protein [Gemella sp. GH3]